MYVILSGRNSVVNSKGRVLNISDLFIDRHLEEDGRQKIEEDRKTEGNIYIRKLFRTQKCDVSELYLFFLNTEILCLVEGWRFVFFAAMNGLQDPQTQIHIKTDYCKY